MHQAIDEKVKREYVLDNTSVMYVGPTIVFLVIIIALRQLGHDFRQKPQINDMIPPTIILDCDFKA